MAKSRIFFWLLAAFIAGVAIASFVPLGVSVVWPVFLVGGATLTYAVFAWPHDRRALFAGFAVLALAFGMFRFLDASRVLPSELLVHIGEHTTIDGLVAAEPVRSARSQQVIVETKAKDRVLVITGLYPEYRYGDLLTLSGTLKSPENFSDTFNYPGYLAKDAIYSTMSFPKIQITDRGRGSRFYAGLLSLKRAFSETVNAHIPEPHASFMGGLILGERRSLPEHITAELQITGTSHIVALSGYNITIIGSALIQTLTFFFVPFSWAFVGSVFGILAFTAMTGAAASVVRAAIMGILALTSRRAGRQYHMRNALTLAAAAMLFQNPKILRFDIGFELSFLATLGLVYGSPVIDAVYAKCKLKMVPLLRRAGVFRDRRDPFRAPRKSLFGEILVTTLSAQLFVLPVLVYRFGKLSLVSPFANLAVLPFIPVTMLFGFLTGACALFLPVLGAVFGWVSALLLTYELGAIAWFSHVPFAALTIPFLAPAVVLLIYALIIIWLIRAHRHAPH